MKSVFLSFTLLLFASNASSQSFNQFYANLAGSCNLDTVTTYLQQFEDLGVKEYNSTELQDARDWLLQKYSQWGYTDIVEDDFIAAAHQMTNIIVTKTGTVYPNTYVIIDGHYDTKNGTGTNDNGTGTAIILELARLLKDVPTEYSIMFIHFSGEEIGLTGSSHYVNNVVIPNDLDIKIVFNIDEVGGLNGMVNNTIVCERDESPPNSNDAQSAIMTNELATCVDLYSTLNTEISFAYASDYVPFMNNGYIVTGLYEKNETPYAHTSQDSIAYVDIPYVYQITKGSMGALAHYAVAYEIVGLEENVVNTLKISPNPAENSLQIQFENIGKDLVESSIYDLSGVLVMQQQSSTDKGTFDLDISSLSSGMYLLKVNSEGQSASVRFVKK